MKKISLINSDKKECGVYNYGNTLLSILSKSGRYRYEIVEISGTKDLANWLATTDTDAIIFNYHKATLPWLSSNLTQHIKIKKFLINGHDSYDHFTGIEHNFVCDCTFIADEYSTPIPRPIPFFQEINYNNPGNIIKIGSLGFGMGHKNFPRIVELANLQFRSPVEVNLHIPYGDYVDKTGGVAHQLANICREIAQPHVTVNVSHNYMPNNIDVVRFLNRNDINIFNCDTGHDGVGVSSSLDFALAAMKPIGVGISNMYRNINWKKEINIEYTPIMEIISKGINPLREFYDKWSNEKLIQTFENQFDKFL